MGFVQIVEYRSSKIDSQEKANANWTLPVTDAFAKKMMALADGRPTSHNLDVIEDRT